MRHRANNVVWISLLVVAVIAGAFIIFQLQAPPEAPFIPEVQVPTTPAEGVMVLEEDFIFATGKRIPAGTPYTVHPSEILAGGPPQGGIGVDRGIPALDMPDFTDAAGGDAWLNDGDLVLALFYRGVAKAYPLRIMNWHEIVNDEYDGEPVLATYCPLCRSGVIFVRKLPDGTVTRFGTSGKLWNADLVMYDEPTETYWSQITGEGILGPLAGQELEFIPETVTTAWGDWKEMFPGTLVLDRDTGFARNYDVNPYSAFETSPTVGFGVDVTDTRLFPKALATGIVINDSAKAWSEEAMARQGLLNDEVGGEPLLVVWDPNLKTTKVFERTYQGEVLTFELREGRLFDNQDREWDFDGAPILGGEPLERLSAFPHYWFALATFYPGLELFS